MEYKFGVLGDVLVELKFAELKIVKDGMLVMFVCRLQKKEKKKRKEGRL